MTNTTTSNIYTSGAFAFFVEQSAIAQFKKNTFLLQAGMQKELPKGYNRYDINTVDAISTTVSGATLTEGTTPAESDYRMTQVQISLIQLGETVTLSDVVIDDARPDLFADAAEELGRVIAETADQYVQQQIDGGSNVLYGGTATTTSSLAAGDTMTGVLLAKASQNLKANAAPMIDGGYVGVFHPHCVYDLMVDTNATGFLDANKYVTPEKIFNGEIGKLHGVRVIESSNIEINEDGGASNVDAYENFVFGKDAFAVVTSGGLQTFIKPLGSGGSSDPLNQRATVSSKIRLGAAIVKGASLYRIEVASTLGSNS